MPDLPWKEAIVRVLKGAGEAMHYTDIAQAIVDDELRNSVGATPSSSVTSTIGVSMRSEGAASPFVKVSRGEYSLRELIEGGEPTVKPESDVEESTGIIHAFGMYWQRGLVRWTGSPSLLGRQQIGADPVDFCGQRGVYLLHSGREVIYVGRSTDRPLGRRLYEHTLDRLRGRWDGFSWFGLLRVTEEVRLIDPTGVPDVNAWIATMEALLIEGLEPRQNRRRGDDFSAVEYLQAEDPEIERQQMMSLLAEMQNRFTKP